MKHFVVCMCVGVTCLGTRGQEAEIVLLQGVVFSVVDVTEKLF